MSERCAEVHSAYGLTAPCVLEAGHDGPCSLQMPRITTTLEPWQVETLRTATAPGFSPEFVILDEKHHYKHTL